MLGSDVPNRLVHHGLGFEYGVDIAGEATCAVGQSHGRTADDEQFAACALFMQALTDFGQQGHDLIAGEGPACGHTDTSEPSSTNTPCRENEAGLWTRA